MVRFGMGQGTREEFLNGLRDDRSVQDGSVDHRRGSKWVGGILGRSGTGRETLGRSYMN